jgi:hypothetical protein
MKKSKTINIRITESQFENLMDTVTRTEKSKSLIIQELLDKPHQSKIKPRQNDKR